jgi:hypothetical protein
MKKKISKYKVPLHDASIGHMIYGDIMTVKQFRDSCERRTLMDCDGNGYPVKGSKYALIQILPSTRRKIPKDATHILWFNK